MKYIFLTLIFISSSFLITAQSNVFSVGYNKNFPLELSNNNIIWCQYKKEVHENFSIGIRTDFHAWEHTYKGNGSDYSNQILAIIPDNEFLTEHNLEIDNIEDGIIQLSTKDALDIDIYSHLMFSYSIYLNKWSFNPAIGAGFTYSKRQGFFSGTIVEVTDDRFSNDIVFLPLTAYQSGLSPSLAANLNVGYALSDNFSLSIDIFFNSQANTIITQGLNANLKF